MRKMLLGLTAIASTVGFFLALSGLEDCLALLPCLILGAVSGIGMVISFRALGVIY